MNQSAFFCPEDGGTIFLWNDSAFDHATQPHIPEDTNHHIRHHKNLSIVMSSGIMPCQVLWKLVSWFKSWSVAHEWWFILQSYQYLQFPSIKCWNELDSLYLVWGSIPEFSVRDSGNTRRNTSVRVTSIPTKIGIQIYVVTATPACLVVTYSYDPTLFRWGMKVGRQCSAQLLDWIHAFTIVWHTAI